MGIQKVIQNIVTEVPKRTRKLVSASLPTPLERDTFQRSTQLLSTVPKKKKKSTLDSLIQIFSAPKYEDCFESLGITVNEYLADLVKTENDASILKLLLKKKYFKYSFDADSVEIILEKSRDNKYKDIILDLCNSKKCIIPTFDKFNESLFDRLYVMRNNNFEKYKKVVNSKNLLKFFEQDITWYTGYSHMGCRLEPFLKTSLLEDLDISEFSKIEKMYSKFLKEADRLECDPHKLTYLYFKKPKIYNYLMEHPDLLKKCQNTIYEVPSVEILEEINKHNFNRSVAFANYVNNNRYVSEQEAQYLNSILEKCKLSNDVTMYRGDSNLLFQSISIKDSPLAKTVKEIVKDNPDIALKEQIFSMGNKKSLYDYILSKKDLTLTDAMELLSAGYKDENLIKGVENAIKHSSIIDNRLKSVTVSETIGKGYGADCCSKLTIKKGTECAFICDTQQEFVLSGNPRKIAFTNATFDPETRKFKLEAIVEPINKQ